MRTAATVAWEPVAKFHGLYWRYLCSIESVAAACIAAARGVAAVRASDVTIAAAATGVAAARGGGGPQEATRPNRWWSRIV